jgi:hypothetical protein
VPPGSLAVQVSRAGRLGDLGQSSTTAAPATRICLVANPAAAGFVVTRTRAQRP